MNSRDKAQQNLYQKEIEVNRIEEAIEDMELIYKSFKVESRVDKIHQKRIKDGLKSLKIIKFKTNVELTQAISDLKFENFKRSNYENEKESRVLAKYGF